MNASFGSKITAVKLSIVWLLAAAAANAQVVFQDDTFANGNWTATKIFDGTSGSAGTFSAGQVGSGGAPGSYRETTLGTSGAGVIVVAQEMSGAVYNPAVSGAISGLSYIFSVSATSVTPDLDPSPGTYVEISLLIKQGGVYYSGQTSTTLSPDEVGIGWAGSGQSGLTGSNFSLVQGQSGAAQPDFSSSGAPLQFGYMTSNQGLGTPDSNASTTGVDNWSVSVAAVPEPASWGSVVGASLIGFVAWRHRWPILSWRNER